MSDGDAEADGAEGEGVEIEIPWLREPVPLAEAVELLARAMAEEGVEVGTADEEQRARIRALERRVGALEDGSDVTCPSCGESTDVLKSGVAAAKFVTEGALSETNVAALNQESHVCLACRRAFTPVADDGPEAVEE